jgi:RND family efflux transporter MFP subunit
MKTLILALMAFGLASCTTKSQQSASLQQLPVIQVASGNATTFADYPAAIQGIDNVEIRPQVSGTLDKVFVEEGAYVQVGQPLFKINEAPYREKLNNARASLHAATGALANSELEIEKLTPLVNSKVIADYQLKTAGSSREIALGNVEQAKADIAAAQINVGYTLIKAPVSGYIGLLPKKRGNLVGPADLTPLTDLSDVKQVHVYFALGEYDFIRFKKQYSGKTLAEKIRDLPQVELILADDSAYTVKGRIDLIDGQFNKNTGAITVRATFVNPEGLLRSGNTGKVRLGLNFSNQLILPQSATLEMQDKTFVFLVDEHNKVTRQPITITGKSGTNYLVSGGLKAGDRIVANGFDHLQDGETIQPEKPKDLQANQIIHQ